MAIISTATDEEIANETFPATAAGGNRDLSLILRRTGRSAEGFCSPWRERIDGAKLTGYVATQPIDEFNRPSSSSSPPARIPPSDPKVEALFTQRRDALPDACKNPHDASAVSEFWPRPGTGRVRTRPDAVMGDKAYSSRVNRALLRARKIKAVIHEPRVQIANRKRKGARCGRPVDFDSEAYKGRSVVEQSFNIFKQRRSIATRYDSPSPYRSGVALHSVLIWLCQ